jgi:Transposase DDE domain
MHHSAIRALEGSLRPHLGLSKSRLETLCLIVVGFISARTVNLGHVACERPGAVLIASTYRRLQRFFHDVRLDQDWTLPLVARMLGPGRRWTLVLDRTQWSIGQREVNYLVLAVVTRHFRAPLLWTLLPRRGNSSAAVRITLIERYLAHFPASTVRMLLADREFVGADWLKFLNENNIPFAIRLREDLRVVTKDGCELTLSARLREARRTRIFRARLWADAGRETGEAPEFTFAAKRLADRWLIVVTNGAPRAALDAYRKRWSVECMFGDAKTRGLNIEDTRLTDPRKLDLLMGLVTLALVWAGRVAVDHLHPRAPTRKSHGYLAQSWFRVGLDRLRSLLRTDPAEAAAPWRRLPSRPLKRTSVV